MNGGGGARWNDETQSWETEERRGYTPPPPPLPSAPPVVPVVPVAPETQEPQGPQGMQGPWGPAGSPGPAGPPAPPGTYNNITGTFEVSAAGGAGGGRSFRERVTPLTAGIAVGVLAMGAAALWFTLGGDNGGAHEGARGASATSTELEKSSDGTTGGEDAGGTDGALPDASASDTAPESAPPSGALPPGYADTDDREGFRIAVPREWDVRTEDKGAVFYKSADGVELIQIFRIAEPITAVDAVGRASEELSSNPGFEEISRGPVESPGGGEAAELVYAYDSKETGGRRQVIERVFTASDGRLYAVLVGAADTEWPRQEEILDVAVTHFDPYDSPF
ncbi:serine/arginine repetitive matrix protein 2 [Streptomyces sp. NPDC079020]|uniref:serine/arginine repetitive matrix protein 2 n=1 Tax=Streptomyces sp. NPDC079020 TaxID=3365722 RepID=UPI0037D91B61